MDKRLSTGRLITDRLILKSLKGAAAAVAVWGGLGYACHFIAERSRAEEFATATKIAVARRVLADTVGEPFAGGGTNCQRLRSVLDGAQSIVAGVNSVSENVIAEKFSEAENKFKRIIPSAKIEASALLGQLKQLKMNYASSKVDFGRRFAVVVDKANDTIQKRASLERKLNQYRMGLKGVIDKSERESLRGTGKRLLDSLEFMNVHGMKPSAVIAKACSEVEDSWAAIFAIDKVVADMIGQVETAKRDIKSKVEELNTFVTSAEELHTKFMHLPAVEKWVHSAEWYRTQCRSIDGSVRSYMQGPYFYDKSLADDLLDKVSELQKKVAEECAPEPVESYRNLQVRYKEFTEKCTWRQGVKHPEVAHVVSSSTPNQWIAESGWEFVHPGTSDLTVRVKWPHSQEWYRNECRVIGDNVRHFTNGPYHYDMAMSNWILNKISELKGKIDNGDVHESVKLHKRIQEAYRDFAAKCTWRQGVAHPKIAHVISSSTPNQWTAEAGWEFVRPGTSDLAVRKVEARWMQPQSWYQRECEVITKNMQHYLTSPYTCDWKMGNRILQDAKNLSAKIYSGQPDEIARMHRSLADAYNQFRTGCRWQSGVRHKTAPHVHSGVVENTWEADKGWTFVNPGVDLSVKRIPVATRCPKCRGNCVYNIRVACAVCKGSRYVPNPVALVGNAVNVGLKVFRDRRRNRHLPSNVPAGPSKVPCSGCNARGVVYQPIQCEQCRGTGNVYR